MNILFVCSRNKWRSRTAETIFKTSVEHQVKSAGTEPSARVKVTAKMIEWADVVFAMEKKHKQRLTQNFPVVTSQKEIIVLGIPDEYQYMDEELVEILRSSTEGYFHR